MSPPPGGALTLANIFILPSQQRNIVQTTHDGDGATGYDNDDDGDGGTDEDVDDDCDGATEDNVRRDG